MFRYDGPPVSAAPFARETMRRNQPQLLGNEGHEPIERIAAAIAPPAQQSGEFLRRRLLGIHVWL